MVDEQFNFLGRIFKEYRKEKVKGLNISSLASKIGIDRSSLTSKKTGWFYKFPTHRKHGTDFLKIRSFFSALSSFFQNKPEKLIEIHQDYLKEWIANHPNYEQRLYNKGLTISEKTYPKLCFKEGLFFSIHYFDEIMKEFKNRGDIHIPIDILLHSLYQTKSDKGKQLCSQLFHTGQQDVYSSIFHFIRENPNTALEGITDSIPGEPMPHRINSFKWVTLSDNYFSNLPSGVDANLIELLNHKLVLAGITLMKTSIFQDMHVDIHNGLTQLINKKSAPQRIETENLRERLLKNNEDAFDSFKLITDNLWQLLETP